MKDKIFAFIEENKKPIIQIGGVVVGGLLGLGLTALIMAATEDEIIDLDELEAE